MLSTLGLVEHRRGHVRDAIDFGRQALQAAYAAGETLDAATAHGHIAVFLAADQEAAPEAPVHLLAAAVIHMRLSGMLATLQSLDPGSSAFIKVALSQFREPALVPPSFADLSRQLANSTAINIDDLLSGFHRIQVRPGSEPGGLVFIMNDPDDSGDSVTDVLSWVQQQVPSSWLADPNSGLPFWQPFIHAAATAAARQADQDIRILLDDLRGASWATLANALEQLIADPATYLVPQDLEHPERVIIQHVLDELERRADCSRWRVAR